MRTTYRRLIAVFLSLLLPLQAGAALAHAVGMAAAHRAPAPQVRAGVPLQLAHAIGVPHQHKAHAHHEHRQLKKAPAVTHEATPKSARANGHCNEAGNGGNGGKSCNGANGAKCCLSAAVAPPSALPVASQPFAVRSIPLPALVPIAAFIPDGPERPPRPLTA